MENFLTDGKRIEISKEGLRKIFNEETGEIFDQQKYLEWCEDKLVEFFNLSHLFNTSITPFDEYYSDDCGCGDCKCKK